MKFLCLRIATAALIIVSRAAASPATVELNHGGAVRGEILADTAERVVVDLGFSVLTIPRDAITRVTKDAPGAAPTTAVGDELFREDPTARPQAVKDLVNGIGDRVVLVKTPVGAGLGVYHSRGWVFDYERPCDCGGERDYGDGIRAGE